METGCALGTCIKFFNLLSNEDRDFVDASLDESFLTICRAFPRAVLLDLTVPLVELTLKIIFQKITKTIKRKNLNTKSKEYVYFVVTFRYLGLNVGEEKD